MVFLVVLVSACGGGASDGVVESGDGRATLSLQPGSLPDGVSPDDVQLEVLVDETTEPGAPVVAVQLLPDGLVLTEPATLTVALPEALEGGFMAIHQSGDSIEFLNGDIIQQDDGAFSFQTPIGHFSVMYLSPGPFFEASLSLDPEQVSVGQTQDAAATIAAKTDPISMWFYFEESDPEDTFRLFRFAALQEPVSFGDAEIRWSRGIRFWNPKVRSAKIIETQFLEWETSPASSTCLGPNKTKPYFVSRSAFSLTLLSRGEPVPRGFVQFSRRLAGELTKPPPSVGAGGGGSVKLLDMSPGDTIDVVAFIFETEPSICTKAGASGSGTTTTSLSGITTTELDTATTGTGQDTSAALECEDLALTSDSLIFTSPDVGEEIPDRFTQRNAYDSGFVTPAFQWSGVPVDTTEIVIFVQVVDSDHNRDILASGNAWYGEVPIGFQRWLVTGIDPATSLLPGSSLDSPLPEGVIEQDGGAAVQINGEGFTSKFVGAGVGAETFLFTIFALCEAPSVGRDVFWSSWLRDHAIGIDWFVSSLEKG
ncbi:MAG: hypothetical protein IH943_10935 [Acidobacteria bacterium]|nr:hypothetical protein [Acidobacteriota bacterium]